MRPSGFFLTALMLLPARLPASESIPLQEQEDLLAPFCGKGLKLVGIGDSAVAECGACPGHDSTAKGNLRIKRVFYGSFTYDGADEAVVELHSYCYGTDHRFLGNALLRGAGEAWRQVWVKPGSVGNCKKLPGKDRSSFVCADSGRGQGVVEKFLIHQTVTTEGWNWSRLLSLKDSQPACRRMVKIADIRSWTLRDIDGDGRPDLDVKVAAAAMKRRKHRGALDCRERTPANLGVFKLQWINDGKSLRRSPSSAEEFARLERVQAAD